MARVLGGRPRRLLLRFGPYALASLLYLSVGVFLPQIVLGWPLGVTFLFVAPWPIAALLRRAGR